jgi:hypothetical protein
VGGKQGRKIVVHTETGVVFVRTLRRLAVQAEIVPINL